MVKEASVQGYSFGQRTAEGLGAGGPQETHFSAGLRVLLVGFCTGLLVYVCGGVLR